MEFQKLKIIQKFKKDLLVLALELKDRQSGLITVPLNSGPKPRLKSGERYSVTFKLGKLKVVPAKFEVFNFDFQVIKQAFSTSITGIKPYVKTDLERQKLTGVVYTADYA
ncbi:MAG: hypothetical protein MZV63_42030 [Marinilabiliales bacterium]|nr:hypothetical protein [Marinilabiliales bacterium]